MSAQLHNLLVVLGPTAAAKTRLGVGLARALGGEIISADSRQVYVGLDIGSGKDLAEYSTGGERVAYHLIDIVSPREEFNLFAYQQEFFRCFTKVREGGKLPVLVGGTGLYLDAVLSGYPLVQVPPNPELRERLGALTQAELNTCLAELPAKPHNTTDLEDRERTIRAIEIALFSRDNPPPPAPEIRPFILGTSWPRALLQERIRQRLAERLAAGLVEEIADLHSAGLSWERLESLGLEYRYVALFLQEKIMNRNDLQQKLAAAICRFAKKQETWFRRMERRGTKIHWVSEGSLTGALDRLEDEEFR